MSTGGYQLQGDLFDRQNTIGSRIPNPLKDYTALVWIHDLGEGTTTIFLEDSPDASTWTPVPPANAHCRSVINTATGGDDSDKVIASSSLKFIGSSFTVGRFVFGYFGYEPYVRVNTTDDGVEANLTLTVVQVGSNPRDAITRA